MSGGRSRCVVFYASKEEANVLCFQNYLEKVYPAIQVIAATDGADAINYFNGVHDLEVAPSLIIMDVIMTSKTGIEALEEIRNHPLHNNTPAVLISKSPFQYECVVEEKLNAKLVVRPRCDEQKKELIREVFSFYGLASC